MTPEQTLEKYWGYTKFRPNQKEIVASILSHNDTLALLPTGGGKSICFQVPAILLDGCTIVISPLISLMKDQVDALEKRNISATYLSSTLEKSELETRLLSIKKGKIKIIYTSPERLSNKKFWAVTASLKISMIVIDEAHCISTWGHDFRPEYTQINNYISRFATRPIVSAFTATATKLTVTDIIQSLKMNSPHIFSASFKRNIAISIYKASSSTEQEIQLLSYLSINKNKSGIIYLATRKKTELIAHRLNAIAKYIGINRVDFYHGGLSSSERQTIQQDFLDDKIQVLVATTAFGMGIDKPNIQFVIHLHPAASIENYFQEIGRAGRGGQAAEAVMFLFSTDFKIQEALIKKSKNKNNHSSQKLTAFTKFTGINTCRMAAVLQYFGQIPKTCQQCDNCVTSISPIEQILAKKNKKMQQLLNWRNNTAKKIKSHADFILQPQQLIYLLLLDIKMIDDLQHIPGIGQGWQHYWGRDLITSLLQYENQ